MVHADSWWHVFDPLHPEQPIPSHLQSLLNKTPAPSPSPQLPFLSTFQPTTPFQQPSQQLKRVCAAHPCQRTRINKSCARGMCPSDCVLNGGCGIHNESQLSDTQLKRIRIRQPDHRPPADPPLASLSPDSQRFLDEVLEEVSLPAAFASQNIPSTSSAPSPTHAPQVIHPAAAAGPAFIKQPKITTQMNPTWMAEYKSSPAVEKAKASSAVRLAQDLSLVRRFHLIFWDNSHDTACIQLVQECPNWPQWSLSTYTGLSLLGDNITHIQLYSTTYHVWVDTPLDFKHSLTTNCAILLRRKGVTGIDEQDQINRFVSPHSPRRFRHDMPAERSAIREMLKDLKWKGKGVDIPLMEGSNSDIEIFNTPRPLKRRRITGKQEPISSPLQRPQLSITIPTTPTILPSSEIIEIPDSPQSPTSFSPFSLLSPISTPTSSLHFPSPTQATLPRWPQGRYAVDIVAGFERMDKLLQRSSGSVAQRLIEVYGCKIPTSTYYDHRDRWAIASQSLRDKVIDGGRTPSGLWTYLASRVPLK